MLALLMAAGVACSGSGSESGPASGPTAPPRADPPVHPFPDPPPESTEPPLTLAPGTSSPVQVPAEGRTVSVELRAPARFMVGEPVFAQLVLTVDGPVPSYGTASFYSQPRDGAGRRPGFVVAFRSADGRVLGQRPGSPGTGGSGQTSGPIELPLWAYARLTPGRYTLHVEANVRIAGSERLIAIEAPVEVTAFDPAGVGRVIDGIGARAVSDEYEQWDPALRLLHEVRDPRVVPWWVRLAQSGSSTRRSIAVQELGKWEDPRARDALIRATRTRTEELSPEEFTTDELRAEAAATLRQGAVSALCRSDDPVALRTVLSLQADPDDEIRLQVLQRAARLPPAQARPFLERGLSDRYEVIRSEARRLLDELPE